MSEIESVEQRLDEHTRQDFEQFQAIRDSLEAIGNKLDVLTERTVRLDTLHEVTREIAETSGAKSGSKWSVIIGIVIAGIVQGCQWITHGS